MTPPHNIKKPYSTRLPKWLIDQLKTLPNQAKAIEDMMVKHPQIKRPSDG